MGIEIVYANTDNVDSVGESSGWNAARTNRSSTGGAGSTLLTVGVYIETGDLYAVNQAWLHFNNSAVTGAVTASSLNFVVASASSAFTIEADANSPWTSNPWTAGDSLVPSGSASLTGTGPLSIAIPTGEITNSSSYGLVLYSAQQRSGSEPAGGNYVAFIHSSAASGTTNDPYLSITTASAATGSGGGTLAAITSSGTGNVLTISYGALAQALGALTASSEGKVAVAGTSTAMLAGVTSSATGAVAIVGAGSGALADLTAAGAGTLITTTVGSLAVNLTDITAAAAGRLAIQGQGALAFEALTSAATGAVPRTGDGAATLDAVTASGSGAAQFLTYGTASVTLGNLALVAAGSVVDLGWSFTPDGGTGDWTFTKDAAPNTWAA